MANKIYSTVHEVAEKLGVTEAYVRELLNRGKIDKTIKLRGTKIGKEWRIDSKSINEYLGIEIDEKEYKKDLYIKELEGKVKALEIKIKSFKTVADSLNQIIGV
ncbi:helix-turn-helix domain-containing protein [Clostridium sp.]|uniref:helix-turn-helix domain-containing protein n=1 Tax=Clostridium sp. TaxID=1506 RepID=UPI002906B642|nr:helix-turn-helix domain-containing protein [Clostridium sp.]MDU4479721.1 helix-turn-helix domain-containing protein [Clostridium sp.]